MQRRRGELGAVLFTDIVGSTAIAAEMGNRRWVELGARHERLVRQQLKRFGGRERDTAGDGFFATFERPADAIRCAVASAEAVRVLGIEIRAGVAFGELETAGRKPGGLVVNTAARVMAVAGPGEVLVPASVRDIVAGSGVSFAEHGVHQLRGLDGEVRLYRVIGVDGRAPAPPLRPEQSAERLREVFPTASRRRALLLGGAAGVVAIAIVLGIVVANLGDGPAVAPPAGTGRLQHAVARVDPDTGRVGVRIGLGGPVGPDDPGPFQIHHRLAAGEGGVWVLRPPLLLHLDPRNREVRSGQIDIGVGQSQTVLTGFDAVWAQNARMLFRVHPGTDEVEDALVLPVPAGITTWSVALGPDAIWVGVSDGTLVRFDPTTEDSDQADTGRSIDQVAATREHVWVADFLAGALFRFDPASLRQDGRPLAIEGSMDQVVGGGDVVWILDRLLGVITRVDAASNEVTGSIRVGNDPTELAVSAEAVWVGDAAGSLYRVDASTMAVEEFRIGAEVLGVAVDDGDGSVWIYAGDPVG
jgi:class 3 adenylate cyclase/streptogramin lyase